MTLLRIANERSDMVHSYFKDLFFVFVPNVCDAACDFCYISPLQGSNGHLTPGVLARTRRFFSAFRGAGFQEARFTGGEPLVFDNVVELFDLASASDLRYAVLTNGTRLHEFVDYFEMNPPSRVTVSVHTLRNAEKIFQVERDPDILMAAIERLHLAGVPVAATLVLDSLTLSDLEATVTRLQQSGIADVKLVAPNVPGVDRDLLARDMAWSVSTSIDRLGPGVRVRHSSLSSQCLLKREATLSVQIPSGRVSVCCATVGEWEPVGDLTRADLREILREAHTQAMTAGPLPCSAHYGACPIALESRGGARDGGHVL